jgi:hypothetical protein
MEVVEVPDHIVGSLGPEWQKVEATETPELIHDGYHSFDEPEEGDEE